jgi:hypothetical protein
MSPKKREDREDVVSFLFFAETFTVRRCKRKLLVRGDHGADVVPDDDDKVAKKEADTTSVCVSENIKMLNSPVKSR